MLKGAIFFNVLLLLIMSIYFIIDSNKKNNKIGKLKELIIVYIIYNIINMIICYNNELVDIDWNIFIIIPVSIISFVLCIISICRANKLLKTKKKTDNNRSTKYLVIMLIPALLFVCAYLFELYVINRCEYLLKYNYQSGMISSEDTYMAIINNKPLSVTLQKNLFNRNGKSYEGENYNVIYNDEVEISTINSNYEKKIIDNEKLKAVSLDAKEKSKDAKSAIIYYLPKGEYVIISLLSNKNSGTVLGEYFYYNGKYVKSINIKGDLESVIYYE